jgi:hypothetical protein
MFHSWATTHQMQTRIVTIILFVLFAALLVVLGACTPEIPSTPPAHGANLLG